MTLHSPATPLRCVCGRTVETTAGLDGAETGRCACGVLLVVVEESGEDGLPVRRLVQQRRARLGKKSAIPPFTPFRRRPPAGAARE